MNPLHWLAFPLAVVAALSSAPARAAGGTNQAVGQAIWNAATKGKTTTVAPGGKIVTIAPSGGGSPIGQVTTAGNTAAGGVAIAGSGTAPVNGKGVPVSVTGTVAKDVLASAVAGAFACGPKCAVAAATVTAVAPHVSNWLNDSGIRINPQTGQAEELSDDLRCAAGSVPPDLLDQPVNASCGAYESADGIGYRVFFAEGACYVGNNCAGYGYTKVRTLDLVPKDADWVPGDMNNQRVIAKLKTPNPGVLDELTRQGQTLTAGDVQVSGPASVAGPTTINITNTSNGPVTTTTTTTNNYTYNGNSVTNTGSKTTTETKQPDGTTTTTSEETTSPGDEQQPEEAPIDTPLGDLPKLYERKYPDGIVGIWNDKRQQLNQTQLFQLPQQLMPTGIGGGSCPTFKIPLDFVAFGDFGEGDVSPPCWVYDVIKVIVLIGAAILARALIFGG